MNKIKYFETENGETIKTAEFDGYNFADRLLEGVMFQATVQEDGTLKVNVSPDGESYFSNFNQEKFLEQALKYANNEDEFYVPGTEENCFAVYETDEEESVVIEATPIAIDKLNLFGTQGEDAVEPEEVKEPVIGQFKTKKTFLNFISAASIRGQNVRFNADFAFIKGEVLSGMLEKAVFKLTICDEGTINFEEVEGTSLSDEAMRKRLVSDIDDSDVTGYAQKYVLNGLEFSDEDGNRCYLEVEHKKPIDLLRSIFDEEDQKEEEMKELSEKGLSVLDSLFADEEQTEEGGLSFLDELLSGDTTVEPFSDEEEVVDVEEVVEEPKSQSVSYLEESFRKMNDGKVNELKNRIEDANQEIRKSQTEIKNAETKLNKTQEELGVLETRLETMQATEEPNGYVFFVSEEKKHETGLDESTKHVADKIADIMKLKKDVLFEMLTEGYHLIKLAKKESDYSLDLGSVSTDGKTKEEIEELVTQVSELNSMYASLMKIDRVGKFAQTEEGVEYRGELNWHQLVSKLIRNGFEQDHEFDKVSGSNSYVNTTESYYEETEEESNVENEDQKLTNLGI